MTEMMTTFVSFLTGGVNGRKVWAMLLCWCLVVSITSGEALAQKSSVGNILGTVTDSSGAVMVNIKITLVNVGTQETREATTDSLGGYRFVFVPVGTYLLRAEGVGFETITVSPLILGLNDERRQDFTMKVGKVTSTVDISAARVAVNAENPTLGGQIDERRIKELPLNGRAFLTLATLVAGGNDVAAIGVEDAANNYAGAGRPGMSVAISGVRATDNEILFDGIPSKNGYENAIGIQPTPDGIAELKILQGYITPEYGSPTSVNVVTKSGTNAYHGALWEFVRNNMFDARNAFESTVPAHHQNQFGGAGGGPIIKNKLFAFGEYEQQEIRGASSANFGLVPLPAFFNGDFSSVPTPIIDPLNGQPFANNQIPSNRISQFAKAAQQFWPAPNSGAPAGFNWLGTAGLQERDKKWSARVDWNKSEKDQVYGRFTLLNSRVIQTDSFPFGGTENPIKARNLSVGWTHVFSPRMVNVARIGLDRVALANVVPLNSESNPNFGEILGLKNLKSPKSCNALTDVSLFGYRGFGGTAYCEIPTNTNPIFSDNFSYTIGRHYITTGGGVLRYHTDSIVTADVNGSLDFSGQFSGNSAADFILGYPDRATGGAWAGPMRLRGWWPNLYANDEFKVTRSLTLDFGVRWDYYQPLVEVHDLQGEIDFAHGGVLLRAGRNGVPRGLFPKHWGDFAPRVGFAWAPGGSTTWAVRSSYGMFYVPYTDPERVWSGLTWPFAADFGYVSDVHTPTINIANLYPTADVSGPPPPGSFMFNLEGGDSDPYLQQWTLSVEHTLPGDIFVQAAYVGSTGKHLSKRINPNVSPLPCLKFNTDGSCALADNRPLAERRPFPQYDGILDDKPIGVSWYDGLQLTARKAYSHGLVGQASYTWSKCLDYDSYDSKAARSYRLDDLDKGRCTSDFRQRFSLSMVYELPFGKNLTGVGRQVLGGWQINTVIGLQTGSQFSVETSRDFSNTGSFRRRALRLCNGNLPASKRNRHEWFDTSCFTNPPENTYGNASPNSMDGPPWHSLDLSVSKNFRITESSALEFRAEAFNFPNLTNLGHPNTTVGDPQYGQIHSAGPARQLQFALKLTF